MTSSADTPRPITQQRLHELVAEAAAYIQHVKDVTESEEFKGPFVMAHIHGAPYGGPYLPEPAARDALLACLSAAASDASLLLAKTAAWDALEALLRAEPGATRIVQFHFHNRGCFVACALRSVDRGGEHLLASCQASTPGEAPAALLAARDAEPETHTTETRP